MFKSKITFLSEESHQKYLLWGCPLTVSFKIELSKLLSWRWHGFKGRLMWSPFYDKFAGTSHQRHLDGGDGTRSCQQSMSTNKLASPPFPLLYGADGVTEILIILKPFNLVNNSLLQIKPAKIWRWWIFSRLFSWCFVFRMDDV